MKKIFTLAILLVLYCGGGEEQTQVVSPEKPIQIAKSVLMVIAPKDFRDEEFKEPYDLFTNSGIKVIVASIDTVPVKGMLGMTVKPDILIDQVRPDSFDALIIIGGTGCQVLWDNTTLHKIVQNFNDTKKTIAAICIAPVVLARAGILKNIKATVYPTSKNDIEKYGASYTGSDVEISGNIITGSNPKASKDFATTILNTLKQ
ncbi:DJ-1/PfpI family protein [candidate division WOR-3 bacterium]|nr:DJ-1/PfpI family protein [candidate division WOR-3 bacterium]